MNSPLAKEISSWDGRSTSTLESIYRRHYAKEGFVAAILAHIASVDSQRAASWLLKKHLEADNNLSEPEGRMVFRTLPDLRHWESKLHLLQCIPYLDIREEDRDLVESFVNSSVKSENKFVRAWAYNGFNELALRFPRYQKKVKAMLTRAVESEAPSVRARIRNILKNS